MSNFFNAFHKSLLVVSDLHDDVKTKRTTESDETSYSRHSIVGVQSTLNFLYDRINLNQGSVGTSKNWAEWRFRKFESENVERILQLLKISRVISTYKITELPVPEAVDYEGSEYQTQSNISIHLSKGSNITAGFSTQYPVLIKLLESRKVLPVDTHDTLSDQTHIDLIEQYITSKRDLYPKKMQLLISSLITEDGYSASEKRHFPKEISTSKIEFLWALYQLKERGNLTIDDVIYGPDLKLKTVDITLLKKNFNSSGSTEITSVELLRLTVDGCSEFTIILNGNCAAAIKSKDKNLESLYAVISGEKSCEYSAAVATAINDKLPQLKGFLKAYKSTFGTEMQGGLSWLKKGESDNFVLHDGIDFSVKSYEGEKGRSGLDQYITQMTESSGKSEPE